MKREAVGHTKMKRLCRRLDIPQYQAVGVLESVWHTVAREAPRGDIGKLSDEDIALAIDYRGDEAKLIEALVYAGWLDRDSTHRLVVHDWADHADDAVQMKLARGHLFFADGRAPKLTRLATKERECAHEFYNSAQSAHAVRTESLSVGFERTEYAQNDDLSAPPEPEPVPEPVPEPLLNICAPGGARVSDSLPLIENPPFETTESHALFAVLPQKPDLKTLQVQWFEEWWRICWRKEDRKRAQKAFQKLVHSQATFESVIAATKAQTPKMLASEANFRPLPTTWLNGERWNDELIAQATTAQRNPKRAPSALDSLLEELG